MSDQRPRVASVAPTAGASADAAVATTLTLGAEVDDGIDAVPPNGIEA
ncbi:MAG: hypothetical protein GZ093_16890 [Rhodoferax sp.]|nr:hypothetical protein [Rhodoferax sp.]NDP40393.1 hypothetical protein [Rhodoferax sp.]